MNREVNNKRKLEPGDASLKWVALLHLVMPLISYSELRMAVTQTSPRRHRGHRENRSHPMASCYRGSNNQLATYLIVIFQYSNVVSGNEQSGQEKIRGANLRTRHLNCHSALGSFRASDNPSNMGLP